MGVKLFNASDPAGQRSTYIYPGNHEDISYRMTTFQNYPDKDLRKRRALAKSGFSYTGCDDRVRCYSCGVCVEQWLRSDDPTHPEWHYQNCPAVEGKIRKSTTDDTRQTDDGNNQLSSTEQQAAAGIAQPAPSTVGADESGRDVCQADLQRAAEESLNDSLFPCNNPVNPHMRGRDARLQTFSDRIQAWSANRVHASPQEICEAGFFYLGQRDRLKCWYCNGGLQNLAGFVNPWFEHAKWYPTCEFILKEKGLEFVCQVTSRFPNLNRPCMTNSFHGSTPGSSFSTPSTVPSRSKTDASLPRIIDPHEEDRLLNRAISLELLYSEIANLAKDLGFSDQEIREAVSRNYRQRKSGFSSVEALVEAILHHPTEQKPCYNDKDKALSYSKTSNASSWLSGAEALENELEAIKISRSCKVCVKQAATVVFLPCGHIACCVACSAGSAVCPLCKVTVSESIRSYHA